MKSQDLRTLRSPLTIATLLLALSSLGLPQNTANNTAVSVPHLIKFSGAVKDVAGAPKTGMVGITFAFYKDQQGGAPLWIETQNVQADANGRYTVMLGATKSDGLPMEFFSSNEARWVGVQPQGQNEQARVLLVSAPYALKASDAETLGGKPASAYVLSTPGADSTTTSKGGAADASVNNSINPPISGTGTPNHIAKWKTKAALENSGIVENSAGQVGIGAAPGNFQFQVTAPNQLGTQIQGPFSGVGAGLDLQTTGTGGKGWEMLATGKTAAQGPNKLNIRDLSTGADVFTIAPGGSIGVDTVNPNGALDVEDASHGNAVVGDEFATSGVTNGVFGEIFSSGDDSTGVLGVARATSGITYGVRGINSNPTTDAAGVEGESFATSGVTFGLVGAVSSLNGAGTVSLGDGESTTGFSLIGCCPAGVWGDTGQPGADNGAVALAGTADDAKAIFGANASPSGVPTVFLVNNDTSQPRQPVIFAEGNGGSCTSFTNGDLHCTGAVTGGAALEHGQRQVALYAVEAPQNWFEDFGSGRLASGMARVPLDRIFAEAANTGVQYHVFLTPRDECEGLYVSNATASGFEVHELHRGRSNVGFDYRIVALRRGYENVRMEDMTERLKKMAAFQPKGDAGAPP